MKNIGDFRIKWHGEEHVVPVSDDGHITLPDGTVRKLSDEQFKMVQEKLAEKEKEEASAKPLTIPAEGDFRELPYEEDPVVDSKSKDASEENTTPPAHQKPQKEKLAKDKRGEGKASRQKNPLTAVVVLLVILLFSMGALLVGGAMMGYIGFKNIIEMNGPTVTVPNSITDPNSIPSIEPGTPDGLDETKTILFIARIKTPEGEEKEVVLGYFTTEDDTSDLPEILPGDNTTSGARDSSSSSGLAVDGEPNGDIVYLSGEGGAR